MNFVVISNEVTYLYTLVSQRLEPWLIDGGVDVPAEKTQITMCPSFLT